MHSFYQIRGSVKNHVTLNLFQACSGTIKETKFPANNLKRPPRALQQNMQIIHKRGLQTSCLSLTIVTVYLLTSMCGFSKDVILKKK